MVNWLAGWIMKSPSNPRPMAPVIDAWVELAKTVMKLTSVTPTVRAAAVEAVRRGFRMAF